MRKLTECCGPEQVTYARYMLTTSHNSENDTDLGNRGSPR